MEHTLNIDKKYITPIDFPDYPAIESFLDECTNDEALQFLDTHRKALLKIYRLAQSHGENNAISFARKYCKENNIKLNPFGNGNRKTAVPSTYRKVGETCPSSCPYLGTVCLAQKFLVDMQAKRAHDEWMPAFVTMTICALVAVANGIKAREKVSGDFYKNGSELDLDYISSLITLGQWLKKNLKNYDGVYGWTYTHIDPEEIGEYIVALEAAGLKVLTSDRLVAGGAIITEYKDVPKLRKHTDVKLIKCLAELSDNYSCRNCDLCSQAKDMNACIVFKAKDKKTIKHSPFAGLFN